MAKKENENKNIKNSQPEIKPDINTKKDEVNTKADTEQTVNIAKTNEVNTKADTEQTVNSAENNTNTTTENNSPKVLDEDVESILAEVRKQIGVISNSTPVPEEEAEEMIDITEFSNTTTFPKVSATVSTPEQTPAENNTKKEDKSSKKEDKKNKKAEQAVVLSTTTPTAQTPTAPAKEKKSSNHMFAKIFCGLVASLVIVGTTFYCMYKFNPDVIPVAASVNVPGGTVKAPDEEVVFLKGIQVSGFDVGGKTLEEAKSLLAVRGTNLLPEVTLTVSYEGEDYTYKKEDLDFTYDLNKAIEAAYEYNQKLLDSGSKDILANAPSEGNVKVDEENNTVNFLTDYKVTQSSVQKVIKRVAKKVDIPCVEPHVSKFDTKQSKNSKRYTYKEGTTGTLIDQDELITSAMEAFNKGETEVSLTATSYTAKPTLKMSDVKNATKLIGKFSTISTNSYNANSNMATALASINGTILEPGDTLSFNECTGNSNLSENGYLPAGVISQGAMTTGNGGGICQAATTLYNAGIMANMEIIEREPHLWCSYYVYGGLDATIDWGNIDLKMKNNSDYQMFFRCWMDGTQLNVEIYGWQSPEFDEIRTETELDWSSSSWYGYNAYRVYYKNGKKIKTEELPYSEYSLSNGGGIRGADPGDVSTKLKQPE